jgi:polyisoprenoid-binding protein YceI
VESKLLFTIRRSDFGMDKMANAIGDDVRLMVSLEGIRQ